MKLNIGTLRLTSPVIGPHANIPRRYAGEGGDNVSPPMEWIGVPTGTREFALVCHDPDAPLPDGFTHWVLYGIPGDVSNIAEGQKTFTQGVNDIGRPGYIGPSPPPGHGVHHYYFWLYALDTNLDLRPGMNRTQLLDRIQDHIVAQARLVGLYERQLEDARTVETRH